MNLYLFSRENLTKSTERLTKSNSFFQIDPPGVKFHLYNVSMFLSDLII